MATQTNHAEDNQDASKKRSNGRRKIPIETIENKTRKHVTFSKRRGGLFKKASELCALCGVEMAILTFSERGKLFCFGHPDPDDVVRRYVSNGTTDDDGDDVACNGLGLLVEDHNRRHEEIKRKIEEEKKFADYCNQVKQGHNWNNGLWWDEAPVDEMGLDELQQFMVCLLELRNNVAKQVDNLTGANLSFSSNQIGDVMMLNQGNANGGDISDNSSFANHNNTHGGHIMGVEDAKLDVVAYHQNEINVEDQTVGNEFNQFPSISRGVELLNLNVMDHYRHHQHQIATVEDQGSSLTHQEVSPNQTFKYESGYF